MNSIYFFDTQKGWILYQKNLEETAALALSHDLVELGYEVHITRQ